MRVNVFLKINDLLALKVSVPKSGKLIFFKLIMVTLQTSMKKLQICMSFESTRFS